MESEYLANIAEQRLVRFQSDPSTAATIVGNASKVYSPGHKNLAELAAWFYIANILLNLDEFVTKS